MRETTQNLREKKGQINKLKMRGNNEKNGGKQHQKWRKNKPKMGEITPKIEGKQPKIWKINMNLNIFNNKGKTQKYSLKSFY